WPQGGDKRAAPSGGIGSSQFPPPAGGGARTMTASSNRAAGAGVALYQRIRSDIEGRIVSGEWPPGHRLPFEHELMDTYSCARMTVNKVISGLWGAGVVEG